MIRIPTKARVRQVRDHLNTMHLRKWACVCALVVVVPTALFFWFFLRPRLATISTLSSEQEMLAAKIDLLQTRVRALSRVKADIEAAQNHLRNTSAHFSQKDEIPDLLEMVSKVGSRSGLEVVAFEPHPPEHHNFYSQTQVALELRGTYHQAARFFESMARLPRLVTIKNFLMQPEKTSSLLKITCTAVAYRISIEEGPEG
jgi:type IV pilus assembly protein PilO